MLAAVASAVGAQPAVSVRAGLIYRVEGTARIGSETLEPGVTRLVQLEVGEALITQRGFAELTLGPDRVMRLGPDTAIELLRDDITDAVIRLIRGSIYVDWKIGQKGATIDIQTTGASVLFSRGGLYRLDSAPALTRLRVYRGKARPANGDAIGKGRQADLRLAEATQATRFDMGRRDFFDRWNARRARAAGRASRAGNPKRRRRGGGRRPRLGGEGAYRGLGGPLGESPL